jgi:hypothetical protein
MEIRIYSLDDIALLKEKWPNFYKLLLQKLSIYGINLLREAIKFNEYFLQLIRSLFI